ncbi:MAG: hypothetical protein FWH27_13390 [Planctomycetaceae bacterium]|nr:hypothetical protein [Planctomycetaceae bacterium]
MTLVELMIVTTIVLSLVVVSVPVVRPMLASRKQADAAQMLSIYLNSARIRAIETGRDCGVMFERYTDNNTNNGMIFPNNDSCLVIRQVEVPPPYVGMNSNVRVAVDSSGNIAFYVWQDNQWLPDSQQVEAPYWNKMVQAGDKIQFDNQGPFYTITRVLSASGEFSPQIVPGDFNVIREIHSTSPATFKVLRLPRSGTPQLTLTPPIGFPSGIIVDLFYSGVNDKDLIAGAGGHVEIPDSFRVASDFRPKIGNIPDDSDPVIVMFSPSGSVSLISPSLFPPFSEGKAGNEPIHFLVGRWELAGRKWDDPYGQSHYPPEGDIQRNYQDMSNFWVTIDQNTGRVRTNPVAPVSNPDDPDTALAESRRYANQSQ